jgi:hypothetical protein
VVEDAASPVGALGDAVQVPPLLLLPQDGRRNRAVRSNPRIGAPTSFFCRASAATKQMLMSEIPIPRNHNAGRMLSRRTIAFAGGVVVTIRMVCAPTPVGVTGLVEKLVMLQAGSGEPAPVTVHVKLTGRLYPLRAVRVTVEAAEVPAFTAAGVVAEIRKPLTVNFTVVECTSAPYVPVTVTV